MCTVAHGTTTAIIKQRQTQTGTDREIYSGKCVSKCLVAGLCVDHHCCTQNMSVPGKSAENGCWWWWWWWWWWWQCQVLLRWQCLSSTVSLCLCQLWPVAMNCHSAHTHTHTLHTDSAYTVHQHSRQWLTTTQHYTSRSTFGKYS